MLIRAAEEAVKKGLATSVSAWVNDALQLKLTQDRKMEALASFISAYEREQGEISPEEIRLATRRARSRAVSARGLPEVQGSLKPRRRNRR